MVGQDSFNLKVLLVLFVSIALVLNTTLMFYIWDGGSAKTSSGLTNPGLSIESLNAVKLIDEPLVIQGYQKDDQNLPVNLASEQQGKEDDNRDSEDNPGEDEQDTQNQPTNNNIIDQISSLISDKQDKPFPSAPAAGKVIDGRYYSISFDDAGNQIETPIFNIPSMSGALEKVDQRLIDAFERLIIDGSPISLIVELNPGESAAAEKDLKKLGYTIQKQFKTINSVLIEIPGSYATERILEIASLSSVAKLYDNFPLQLELQQSVPLISANKLWGMKDSFNQNITGKNVTIAILDTGFIYNHTSVGCTKAQIMAKTCPRVVDSWNFFPSTFTGGGTRDVFDYENSGHGTHVMGIAGMVNQPTIKGVAPNVKFALYKVCHPTYCRPSEIIPAIERAMDPNGDGNTNDHYDIITMSIGGLGQSPDHPNSLAIDSAFANGTLVLVSAGNYGFVGNNSIACPACAKGAVAVGASTKQGTIWSDSSLGYYFYNDYAFAKPSVVVPGYMINSSYKFTNITGGCKGPSLLGTYCQLSGTSMSSPMVAGAAALLKQSHPTWNSKILRSAVTTISDDLGFDWRHQGVGELNVSKSNSIKAWFWPTAAEFGNFRNISNHYYNRSIIINISRVLDNYNNSKIGINYTFIKSALSGGQSIDVLHDMLVADLNNDGFDDIIAMEDNTAAHLTSILISKGNDLTFTNVQNISDSYQFIAAPEVFDVNNDGYLDLIGTVNNSVTRFVYLNNGSGHFTRISQMYLESTTRMAAHCDIDNDGDIDEIISGENTVVGLRVLKNDGSGHFISSQNLTGVNYFVAGCADNDGDNQREIVAFSTTAGNDIYIHLFENDGSGHFTENVGAKLWLTNGYLIWHTIANDFDNDGFTDFIAISNTGNPLFVKGTASGFGASQFISANGDFLSYSDLDLDGYDELITTGHIMPITILKWNGTIFKTVQTIPAHSNGQSNVLPMHGYESEYGTLLIESSYNVNRLMIYENAYRPAQFDISLVRYDSDPGYSISSDKSSITLAFSSSQLINVSLDMDFNKTIKDFHGGYIIINSSTQKFKIPWLFKKEGDYLNHPPVAEAGLNLVPFKTSGVPLNVTLNGTGSYDLDNDTLTYNWSIFMGSYYPLNNRYSLTPRYTVLPNNNANYSVWKLTVCDGKSCSYDYVDVRLSTSNFNLPHDKLWYDNFSSERRVDNRKEEGYYSASTIAYGPPQTGIFLRQPFTSADDTADGSKVRICTKSSLGVYDVQRYALCAQDYNFTCKSSTMSAVSSNVLNGADAIKVIRSCDIDGDTDTDLIFSGTPDIGLTTIKNNGIGGFTMSPIKYTMQGTSYVTECFDKDGDGDKDLAVFETIDSAVVLKLFLNSGAGGFSEDAGKRTTVKTPGFSISRVFSSDLDNDSINDFVAVGTSGELIIVKGTAAGFGAVQYISATGNFVSAANVDVDAYKELILTGDNSPISIYGINGGVFQLDQTIPAHGNGKANILPLYGYSSANGVPLLESSHNSTRLQLYTNYDGSYHSYSFLKSALNAGQSIDKPHDLLVGDLNNDGFDDFIVMEDKDIAPYTTSVFISNGAGLTFTNVQNISVANGVIPASTLADVNMDGYLDLIQNVNNDGMISVYTNDQTGHFALSTSFTALVSGLSERCSSFFDYTLSKDERYLITMNVTDKTPASAWAFLYYLYQNLYGSNDLTINRHAKVTLNSITQETPSSTTVDPSGRSLMLGVYESLGTDAGKIQPYHRGDLVHLDFPSKYTVTFQNLNASAVNSTGYWQTDNTTAGGNYIVRATISNGGFSEYRDVIVKIITINHPPVANAGLNLFKYNGTSVQLNGSGSYDPDGDIITYNWTRVAGTTYTLSNQYAKNPSYTTAAADIGASPFFSGVYTVWKLTVSDGKNTSVDYVDVRVAKWDFYSEHNKLWYGNFSYEERVDSRKDEGYTSSLVAYQVPATVPKLRQQFNSTSNADNIRICSKSTFDAPNSGFNAYQNYTICEKISGAACQAGTMSQMFRVDGNDNFTERCTPFFNYTLSSGNQYLISTTFKNLTKFMNSRLYVYTAGVTDVFYNWTGGSISDINPAATPDPSARQITFGVYKTKGTDASKMQVYNRGDLVHLDFPSKYTVTFQNLNGSSMNSAGNWQTNTGTLGGDYIIRVNISNGAVSEYRDVKIRIIAPANIPPVISSVATNSPVYEGQTATITVTASDADGDPLTYSINDSRFAASGNTFTYTTTGADIGIVSLRLNVTDGKDTASSTVSFEIKQNPAPVLSSLSPITIYEGEKATITASATDANGDPLTYSINDSRFTQTSANTFEWNAPMDTTTVGPLYVPDTDASGTYSVRITVSDGTRTDSKNVLVTVKNTYIFRVGAAKYESYLYDKKPMDWVSPSTIMVVPVFDSAYKTLTAIPVSEFTIKSDTKLSYTCSGAGYLSDTDYIIFDDKLQNCVIGSGCSFTTNGYTTTCSFKPDPFDVFFECTVSSPNLGSTSMGFTYSPNNNKVWAINYLMKELRK